MKNHARSSHLFQIMRVLNAGQEEECTTHIAELSDFFFYQGQAIFIIVQKKKKDYFSLVYNRL